MVRHVMNLLGYTEMKYDTAQLEETSLRVEHETRGEMIDSSE
jgi:hypothetical protein